MIEAQAPKLPKFDLEIERDPNTLKPKIMVLKEENKVAVKVRNNGPNSTKCEVGVRITGGYSSLHPDGYVKFKGKSNYRVEIAPGAQTWVFIPVDNPDVDLDEELTIEAWVANYVDVHDGVSLSFIEGADTNPTNNDGSKEFFIDHKISAGSIGNTNFVIENPFEEKETTLQILTLPLGPVPIGWKMSVRRLPNFEILTTGPLNGAILTLLPGERFYGTFTIQTPEEVLEGQSINLRLVAMDVESNEIIFLKEIYLAYDNAPPEILGVNVSANEGFLNAWISTQDSCSGIEVGEIYYSTDDGETWSSKQMNYSFEMELVYGKLTSAIGPFSNDTEVKYYFNVKDGVGNWAFTTPAIIRIETENKEYIELKQKTEALQSSYNSLEANFTSLKTIYIKLKNEFDSFQTAQIKMAKNYSDQIQLMLYIIVGAVVVIILLCILLIRIRTSS